MDDVALPLSQPPSRDWSQLPLDALASIFVRLGAVEVLVGAGLVCRSWLEAAKLPDVWRIVRMDNHEVLKYGMGMRAMAKAAVDRSDGQLRVFAGSFVHGQLLQYILERSPKLTTLRLLSCLWNTFSERLLNMIRESPLLELRSLEVLNSNITVRELNDVLECCPALESFWVYNDSEIFSGKDEEQAMRAKFARIRTMKVEYHSPQLWFYNPSPTI